jgi:protein TonB
VSVQIPFSLIDRLEKDAVESFRSLTSRGSEIGGLLVGLVSPGNPLVVSIADYQLIECDYSRGPLYRLSDADMGRFEQAREQRLAGGAAIAGFFRSHTRKGISLDSDDLTFFQDRFRDPHHIALLVRPFATKASTAGIFIWENGKVNGEASALEFPFRSSELGPGKIIDPIADSKKSQPPAAPAKPPVRAQIVPIASRREISIPPVTAAETSYAAPTVAPPPPAPAAPTPSAPPPPPAARAEVKAPVVEEKQAKSDKQPVRPDRSAKSDAVKTETAKTETVRGDSFKIDPLKAKADAIRAEALKANMAMKAEAPVAPAAPEKPARQERQEKAAEPMAFSMGATPEPSSGMGMKIALAGLLAMVLVVVLFFYPGLLNKKSGKVASNVPGDSSALQLHVDHTAGDLLVSWNRDANEVKNASKATLFISDGTQHEAIEMDLAQLRNGSVVYTPTSSDISFQMEVLDKGQKKTTSESVRVLGSGKKASPLAEETASQATPAKPATSQPTAAVPGKPAAPGTPMASAEAAASAPEAETPATKATAAPLKQFKAPDIAHSLRPATPADIAEAPAVSSVTPASADIGSLGAAVPTNLLGAAPSAKGPDASKKAPAANGVKAGGNILQAVLIHRQDPEYPKLAKQTGARGQVTLTATIGKDGLIKSVKVVSGHPMLTSAAVAAVKQYRYKPTMLNGQPVESETTVTLNFDFANNR